MKKVFYLIGAAALILTAACQKETVSSNNGITLTATLEQQVDAKTSLNEGGLIYWSENNAINVFTTGEGAGNFKFDLVQGAGTAAGKFKNNAATGTPAYAIYPYNAENTIDGSVITFNLPAVQKYVPNSFANDANVSVAAVNDKSMAFKNVCGALKLNITGIGIINKITVRGNNGEKLWGTFTADAANASPACQTVGTSSDEEKVITLEMDEPLYLKKSTPTSFILVVPVGAFGDTENGGFEVKGYLGEREMFAFNTTDSRNIINRSNVRAMPAKNILPHLPEAYESIPYLSSGNTGGPYIITDYIPQLNDVAEMQYSYNAFMWQDCLFGCHNTSSSLGFHLTYYDNKMYVCANGVEQSFTWTGKDYDVHTIKLDTENGRVVLDGQNVADNIGHSTYLGAQRMGIFVRNDNSETNLTRKSAMKCYSLLVTNNDSIVAFFVPVRRIDDQELGMYDYISRVFYTNDGTGSFETE